MKYMFALAIALCLNAAANLLMKAGMKVVQESGGIMQHGLVGATKTVLSSSALVVGLICFGVNAMFYMYALQSPALKISIAYPIMVGHIVAINALHVPAIGGKALALVVTDGKFGGTVDGDLIVIENDGQFMQT